ncbi:MAG: nucleoid-associated protein [Saprospiraceae bacterium]
MLDFSQTRVVKLSVTWSGNKELNEGVVLPGSTLVAVNDYVHEVLIHSFIKSFEKTEAFFSFTHQEDVSHNEVYQSCLQIFENPEVLSEQAKLLTQRMYNNSVMPRIKGGEFFVALFDEIGIEGEKVPGIGLFKVVQKEPFLRVEKSADAFILGVMDGIQTSKLAMAALILGVDEAEGYRIVSVDHLKKKEEPSIWQDQFLQIAPIQDDYFHTQHFMEMTNDFIQQKASAKFQLDTPEKIDLLNRSSFYFKEHDNFEMNDFASTLFEDPEQQEVFKEYKTDYMQYQGIPLEDQFDINKQAVRKTGRVFKSVIKLDTNFSLYVHGRRDLIERGFDEEKGKPFYKLYFEREE